MKVVLGLSGGVDSAVSARLLQDDGFEVHGLYMDNGASPGGVEAAKSVADFLKIPLTVVDTAEMMEKYVCKPFADAYSRGETPNPCIICNPTVKMKLLCDMADSIGAEKIATGHYVRAENGALYMGRPQNDQSYMLCRVTREQAERLVLPLGSFEKNEVRDMAEGMGIPVAHKPDSMEICFIPDNDYAAWLEKRGVCPPEGDFILNGRPVGRHQGIHRYTVGQRRGFGVAYERRLYVSKLDAEKNQVILSVWEDLFTRKVRAENMNWLISEPREPFRAKIRVRHTRWENPMCTVTPDGNGGITVETDDDLRAPAPGQSAVLYDGERLLGGGFITP